MSGIPVVIDPLDVTFGAEDNLSPGDFNWLTQWSITWQDVWARGHRVADGSHFERVIPSAAFIGVAGGGPHLAAENVSGLRVAAGRWQGDLNPDLASAERYAVFAWPSSNDGAPTTIWCLESERLAAKTASNFEVETFNQAGVAADRDVLVLVFGPRPGEN